jgi:hypothetical protein
MTISPTLAFWLHALATALTFAFGLWSFLQPRKSASTVFFSLQSNRATAEYRVGFGGMLIGISLWIAYAQSNDAIKALGFIWLGAAVARILAFFIDQPQPKEFYWAAVVFELVMTGCLLI